MVFMFFNGIPMMEKIGIIFIVLNILFSIFAICLNKGKFVYIDVLLRFHMILAFSLIGCLLFPLGTLVIFIMALDNLNFKCNE